MLVKLKEFLTITCGWTLWDDGMAQAQPYFVVFSAGESGKEDIYLQFINEASTNVICVRGALYWDPVSHTAIKPVYTWPNTAFVTSDTSPFNYWMFASLDRVLIVTRIGANYFGHYSGLIKRFWSDEVAITQSGINSGDNVTIPVNDASFLSPGKNYIIKDNANIACVQVIATDISSTPSTVTVASLTTGYSAGAKIGEDPQPVIVGTTGILGGHLLNRHDGYGGQTAQPASAREFSGYQSGASDPDSRYRMVAMFPILVTSELAGFEELRGELIDVFSIGSGAGASEDVIDLGTSTYKMFYTSYWIAIKE